MQAKEKEVLYTFFKTAIDSIEGFRGRDKVVAFSDDEVSDLDTNNSIVEDSSILNGTNKRYSTFEELKEDVLLCSACPLCKERRNVVFGDGPKNENGTFAFPPILVIGEAPGADEDEKGLPFVGASGKLLDKMLNAIGLSRGENCFITNMVKCRPPQNRNPKDTEIACCSHFLSEQLRLLKPHLILLLGSVALKSLLKTKEGISHLHGRLFYYEDANGFSIPTIATYHPSALLRDESLKRPAWDDLKFFRSKMTQLNIL